MKKLTFIILAIGFLFYACGEEEKTSSSKQETTSTPNGEKLYSSSPGNCYTCHGVFGEPVLAGAKDLRNPELTLEQRIATITNGSEANPTMIAFKDKLSEAEIKAIAEYTMTLIE